jgi:hypothetical protein
MMEYRKAEKGVILRDLTGGGKGKEAGLRGTGFQAAAADPQLFVQARPASDEPATEFPKHVRFFLTANCG